MITLDYGAGIASTLVVGTISVFMIWLGMILFEKEDILGYVLSILGLSLLFAFGFLVNFIKSVG